MEKDLTGIGTERSLCCGEGLGIIQAPKMRKANNLGPLNPNFLSVMMILQSGSSKIFPWTVVSSRPHIKSIYFEGRIHTHTRTHAHTHRIMYAHMRMYIHTHRGVINQVSVEKSPDLYHLPISIV